MQLANSVSSNKCNVKNNMLIIDFLIKEGFFFFQQQQYIFVLLIAFNVLKGSCDFSWYVVFSEGPLENIYEVEPCCSAGNEDLSIR